MAGRDISFELERFEWVTAERLEVEGAWNGVRRLVRATLVIDVDGDTRRLRALPEDPGSPEQWTAAFEWKGGELPKLEGAELEVGRSIVVDLPRPRTSKARGEAKPQKPIPATTRADKTTEAALEQVRAEKESEKESLQAEVERLRAEAEDAAAEREAFRVRAEEADALRAAAEEAAAERDAFRATAEETAAERDAARAAAERAETERDALQEERAGLAERAEEAAAGADAARAEHETLRAQAREADALRVRLEDAEAQRDALRAQADEAVDLRNEVDALRAQLDDARPAVAPDVARLRTELESVERERSELRAQLDSTSQQLQDATQAMPPPTQEDAPDDARERLREARRFDRPRSADQLAVESGRRRTRRPAERTAKAPDPDPEPEPTASLSDKVTGWVGSVMGTRDEDDGTRNGKSGAKLRERAGVQGPAPEAAPTATLPARRARRRSAVGVPQAERRRESPSWPLRVAALGLLALLLLTLVVIVSAVV